MVIAFVYLIFGLYFINSALNFITLPSLIGSLDKWITFGGGLLILLGGFSFWKIRREKFRY